MVGDVLTAVVRSTSRSGRLDGPTSNELRSVSPPTVSMTTSTSLTSSWNGVDGVVEHLRRAEGLDELEVVGAGGRQYLGPEPRGDLHDVDADARRHRRGRGRVRRVARRHGATSACHAVSAASGSEAASMAVTVRGRGARMFAGRAISSAAAPSWVNGTSPYTWSPSASLRTAEPSSTTMPATSCAGITGVRSWPSASVQLRSQDNSAKVIPAASTAIEHLVRGRRRAGRRLVDERLGSAASVGAHRHHRRRSDPVAVLSGCWSTSRRYDEADHGPETATNVTGGLPGPAGPDAGRGDVPQCSGSAGQSFRGW